jgi:hypothetical protein
LWQIVNGEGLDGGWGSLALTSLRVKFPAGHAEIREFELENCQGSRRFFLKFPKSRNRELILNSSEIFGGIRESNEAIRETQ